MLGVLSFVARLGLYTAGLIAGFGVWGGDTRGWWFVGAALVMAVVANAVLDAVYALVVFEEVRRDRLRK